MRAVFFVAYQHQLLLSFPSCPHSSVIPACWFVRVPSPLLVLFSALPYASFDSLLSCQVWLTSGWASSPRPFHWLPEIHDKNCTWLFQKEKSTLHLHPLYHLTTLCREQNHIGWSLLTLISILPFSQFSAGFTNLNQMLLTFSITFSVNSIPRLLILFYFKALANPGTSYLKLYTS